MKLTILAIFTAAIALVACGGGSGGSSGGGGYNPPPCTSCQTNPPPTNAPTTTDAHGVLVDDPSGRPLAGVKVQVDPWAAYPTPGPTPTPILTTTTDGNGHFSFTAKNGDYLLVIGAESVNTPPPGWSTPVPSATDTPIPGARGWRPTIHDHIVLTGGTQTLTAPTMPPEPAYTPPAVETHGKYRLATLDALTEAPCILAFNAAREANGRNPAFVDEWATENARAIASPGDAGAGQLVTPLSTGNVGIGGGNSCSWMIRLAENSASATKWLFNSQTLWYGGYYSTFDNNTQAWGASNFPIDPRVYKDPNGLVWP